MGKRTIVSVLLLFLLVGCLPQTALSAEKDLDVYLLYRRSSKEAKTALLSALPKEMQVKSFNVSLLALANFEEKQKVISEIEKARVVVVLNDFPMEILSGYRLNTGLLIINSINKTVTSDLWTLYLLTKSLDVSTFNTRNILEAANEKDLMDIKKQLWPFGIILINEETLGIEKAASVILQTILARPEKIL